MKKRDVLKRTGATLLACLLLTGQATAASGRMQEGRAVPASIRPPNTPNDPCYQSYQWNLSAIDAYSAYLAGLTGEGVRVGFVDSGVNTAHEDLNAGKIGGANFAPDGRTYSEDTLGHGTFSLGIAAAQTNNGVGLTGIAPNMELKSYRVFTNKNTEIGYIVSALDQAVADGCRVINLSLGTSVESPALASSVKRAVDAGCILVAAAGNEGGGRVQYPAGYDGVIGVGSVDADLRCSGFSQRNRTVDFAAPGGGVPGLGNVGSRAYKLELDSKHNMGTSFAAPVVTAMAALALEYESDLTAESVYKLLKMSAVDMGEPGRDDEYGEGMVNVKNLVEALRQDYSLTWNMNGAPEQGGLPASYSIRQKPALPEAPRWAGHTFAGWYLTPECTGAALTEIPADAVGALTLYAGWQEDRAVAVGEATAGGYQAVEQADGSLLVHFPYGADLTAVTAGQIRVRPLMETSRVGAVTGNGDGTFSFSVTSSAPRTSRIYTLRLENALLHPREGQREQTGSAVPAPLDGQKKPVSYVLPGEVIRGWFAYGDGRTALPEDFTVTAELLDGAGRLTQAETEGFLTYTPSSEDAGQTVLLALRGSGTVEGRMQTTPDTVMLRIRVSPLPASTPVMLTSGFFFDRSIQTGADLDLKLYGSELSDVFVGGRKLARTEYRIERVTTDGNEILKLNKTAFAGLAVPGSYDIELGFRGVRTRLYTQVQLEDSGDAQEPLPDPGAIWFPVFVERPENGTVSARPEEALPGETVTLIVSPQAGYRLQELTVKDDRGNRIGTVKEAEGHYTFMMPETGVSVSAAFESMSDYFEDVPAGAYYFLPVHWAVEQGVTAGVGGRRFGPDITCTRAQAVTFLWRACGAPAGGRNDFADVDEKDYFSEAVSWAVKNGITSGTGGNTFSPHASCTRAQIVTFLWRGQGRPEITAEQPFADVPANAYYRDAVLWAVENGITYGTGEHTFGPDADCTRAEIVTFLFRTLEGEKGT